MILNSPYITGSITVTGNANIQGQLTVTGSLSGTATSASYAYTASSAINATSASTAISSSYSATASFSNDFTVLGNLTVFGTQSVQYITSSQLNISDNVITVNVASPGVRFGGLSVFDSGSLSSEATASLFWDSQNNHWVYQRESGSTYTGGMLISGPRNAAGLGNELGTTACMLLVGQGGDHLTSSLVYHSTTCTNFYSNALFISSSGNVGIGTNAPTRLLDVSNTSGDSTIVITSADATGQSSLFYGKPSDANIGGVLYNHCNNQMSFRVNDTTKMSIASTGNVGIGTCTPDYAKLNVYNNTNDATYNSKIQAVFGNSDYRASDAIQIFGAGTSETQFLNGSTSRPAMISLGGNLATSEAVGVINFFRSDNAATYRSRAQIWSATNTTGCSTTLGGYVVMSTADTGQTNPQERLRITSGGNVLIGNPSGVSLNGLVNNLSVSSTTYNLFDISRFSDNAFGPNFYLLKSRNGTIGGNTIVASGDNLGNITWLGANGTGFTDAAAIRAEVDGTPGASNDMPGRLVFSTTADGSGTTVERMRITSGGFVGIGTSSPEAYLTVCQQCSSATAATAPYGIYITGREVYNPGSENAGGVTIGMGVNRTSNRQLWIKSTDSAVNGTNALFRIQPNGTQVALGSVSTNGDTATSLALNASCVLANGVGIGGASDERVKDDIVDLNYGLASVMCLRPRTFKFKGDCSKTHVGFVAQEVLCVLPNFVVHDRLDDTTVKYGNVELSEVYRLELNGYTWASVLTKAIQEQQCTINTLKTCLGIS